MSPGIAPVQRSMAMPMAATGFVERERVMQFGFEVVAHWSIGGEQVRGDTVIGLRPMEGRNALRYDQMALGMTVFTQPYRRYRRVRS